MRRRRVYLILGVVLLVGLLVAVFSREREPEYGGKKLSEWVEILPGDDVAEKAIRQIGTKALPYLLKWIETPRWETKLNSLFEKFNSRLIFSVERYPSPDSAVFAFRALGPKAEAAIPELTRILNNTNGPLSAHRASLVLSELGTAGLPALLGVLTNQQAPAELRCLVGSEIVVIGTNAADALPAWQHLLMDPDASMRSIASNALRKIIPVSYE